MTVCILVSFYFEHSYLVPEYGSQLAVGSLHLIEKVFILGDVRQLNLRVRRIHDSKLVCCAMLDSTFLTFDTPCLTEDTPTAEIVA